MQSDQPAVIRLADYRPPDYLVETVTLDFDLIPEATRVTAQLELKRNPAAGDGPAPLVLDGDELRLLGIAIDGRDLGPGDYALTDESLTIPAPPAAFTLTVETEINPKANTRLEGLYVSSGNFCTQCEAEGFRRITFFPDRPDVMSVYRVTMRADKAAYPVLLSNGNLLETAELPDGRHMAVWHDPFPKPAYLFALVAGDLAHVEDRFTTASGRDVTLRIYVEHGNEDRCAYAMDALKRSMRWDEERFGLEYDLDLFNIVAVGDFNMGAMENKSLNIFNSKYILANAETATDADYSFIEGVVAHEYFHNWTGNRVTCRDWFQLSLKEGLTVFRDQEFSSDMRSRPVKRIQDVRALRARQFQEDSGPLAHPVRPDSYIEINNFYTATVYEKGAEVIGMMHRLLGRDGFRKGMDLYFQRHDGQAVTCDDFAAAMADANNADLSQFKLWYSQAGTPELRVSGEYDADARTYDLTVAQHLADTPGQSNKAPMHIPLSVGLLDTGGNDMTVEIDGAATSEPLLHLTEAEQTFRFANVATAPVLSVNRDFTAPVTVKSDQNAADRAFLMARDADPFSRWEAGQQYATDMLLGMVEAVQAGSAPEADTAFIDALAHSLADDGQDKAFRAQVLALPSEDYLGDQMDTIDVDAIHTARQALRRAIAERLKDQLLTVYRGNQSNEPFSPDAASAGQRALKNGALAYLVELDNAGMLDLAIEQYRGANNMTDRMAALALLSNKDKPARAEALDDFYRRFAGDTVVIDKWLAVQAMSSLPDTLDQVTALLGHEAFSIRNPNKVRSLIGAFASGNALRFHAADGAGYRFLADRVLELDPMNPQVAARLASPLGRWRRFDTARQALMQAELKRILAEPKLSKDVYEIASKSLA